MMMLFYFAHLVVHLWMCLPLVSTSHFSNDQKGSRDQAFHLENRNYLKVPTEDLAMHPGITSLLLQFNKISVIRKGDFPRNITQSLVYINLRGNDIAEIEEDAFSDMPNLHVVDLNQNYLTEVPKLKGPKIRELHLRHNKIRTVEFDAMQHYQNIEHLDLKHNEISAIYGGTFRKNKRMVFMVLSGNPLHLIEETALVGPTDLQFLYLENTKLDKLPSLGISSLATLDVKGTPTLLSLPDPHFFEKLTEVAVEYSMHCCAFRALKKLPKLNKFSCTDSSSKKEKAPKRRKRTTGMENLPNNETDILDGFDDIFQQVIDSFEVSKSEQANKTDECKIFIELEQERLNSRIKCSPKPDEFNPCEDVMGTHVLRIFSWFISIFAVIGNIFQLVILFYSRQELSVYKLLMYNLGFSNLLMGIYLLVLCCVDGHTYGRYYNFAQSWQYGGGCKTMGLIALFATQLSVCSLLLITIERFLLIIFALEVQNQMKLKHAVVGVIFSWMYSFVVACLPLTETISSYTKVAICLPMSMRTTTSSYYVVWLLLSYVIAFLVIVICYVRMYINITEARPGNSSQTIDIQVAKRMSMIIFSNFLCWLPISIAGLMAMYSSVQFNVGVAKFLLVFIFPLNACTNPFLYAIFTKVFRGDTLALLSSCGLRSRSYSERERNDSYKRETKTTIPQIPLHNFVDNPDVDNLLRRGLEDTQQMVGNDMDFGHSQTDMMIGCKYQLETDQIPEHLDEQSMCRTSGRYTDHPFVKMRSDTKRSLLDAEIKQCRDPRFRTESYDTCSTVSVSVNENDELFSNAYKINYR